MKKSTIPVTAAPSVDRLVQLNNGDERGLAYFFEELSPYLTNFMWCMLPDMRDRAYLHRDIISISFMHLVRRVSEGKQFESGSHVLAYMMLVARREVRGKNRKRNTAGLINHNIDPTDMCIAFDDPLVEYSVEKRIIDRDTHNEAVDAIERLPPAVVSVMKYLLIEGMSPQETSRRLGKSYSTIKNQRTDGLLRLKNTGIESIFAI